MDFSEETVIAASEAFLAAMRREFVRKHPQHECPVKPLGEYPPMERQRLKRSIRAALIAATRST